MNRGVQTTVIAGVLVFLAITIFGNKHSQPSEYPQETPTVGNSASAKQLKPVGHPLFDSPHFQPIAIVGDRVFVVNTPSDTVDVLDRESREVVKRIPVGIDPVCVAARPDEKEVWVSNHVSDSVSVIDTDHGSKTFLHVVATIQDFAPSGESTRFDEPVGIAFASNDKAYVALSSENQIAVIDVQDRLVSKRLTIPAQDPRGIFVQGNRLFVIPFESNNKTQLSGGSGDKIDGDLVTFDAWQHSVFHNNVLSLGHVVDIVKHPDVPDRDLFIFDTKTDQLIRSVDTLGTLLYGIAVSNRGEIFITQTDARNDVNGRSGTKKHGLAELDNRAFLNQITHVDISAGEEPATSFIDLEPLPPNDPKPGQALATPFGIQVSSDNETLVVTAAGSDKLFTVDTNTGKVIGRVSVGSVPRGVALEDDATGTPRVAWVYNAVANSVSVVDVSDLSRPRVDQLIELHDKTDPSIKRGRALFNDANASSTGTFSCASCHPDGHTDQLLWVLKTPVVTGGDQIMPRSTMPIRGLRDTAPFHWDGIPGDPYGGNNSANIYGTDKPNSDAKDPESAARHLIDGGLASTMLKHGSELINDEGKSGALSAAQRADMAKYMLSVPYPPAQRRAYTNVVSNRAKAGFELFHIKGHHDEKPKPNVCGDCHRMPFLVSTNTPGTGMDAPTWRGAYDRFLILPQGRLNIVEFGFFRNIAEQGIPERQLWQFSWQGQPRFDPIWDMVLEGSTGFSGAFARQATLNDETAKNTRVIDLLDALEQAATEGAIVLEADGMLVDQSDFASVSLQFNKGNYIDKSDSHRHWSRDELMKLATSSKCVLTFTARHGEHSDAMQYPQPAIWTRGPIEKQSGHQDFPVLYHGNETMSISGRHIDPQAKLLVNGRLAKGTVALNQGDDINISLSTLPNPGMHLLQVQNPDGRFSNDFIFTVAESQQAARELRAARVDGDRDIRDSIAQAIADDDIEQLKAHLQRRQQAGRVNEVQPSSGSTPLSNAALRNRMEIAKTLLRRGARVNGKNRDGNTALHVAAFLCHKEMVQFLLNKGASPEIKNERGESSIDVVSAPWSDELAAFYTGIGNAVGIKLDLRSIQERRPLIRELLVKTAKKNN